MNVDFRQLAEDKEAVGTALADDDSYTWEAWDRICIILEELEDERRRQPTIVTESRALEGGSLENPG